MSKKLLGNEERRQNRVRRSDSVAWRQSNDTEPRTGWLLESSEDGFAFAWRGDGPPRANELIEVDLGSDHGEKPWVRAVVRHAEAVHDNLRVIGAQIVQFRPFPPAGAKLPNPSPGREGGQMLEAKGVSREPGATTSFMQPIQPSMDFAEAAK